MRIGIAGTLETLLKEVHSSNISQVNSYCTSGVSRSLSIPKWNARIVPSNKQLPPSKFLPSYYS